MADKKKLFGSVAVDSETNMETYGVPKAAAPAAKPDQPRPASGEPMRQDFQTPNYGESNGNEKSRNLAGVSDEFLHLFEHDPSEVIVYQATRHPIGVVAIFVMAGVAVTVIVAAYALLLSDSSFLSSVGANKNAVGAIGGLVAVVLVALVAGIALLAAYVYKKSRLILTNQKVVLIQYHSLIAREVSQLNIGEVEDVNVSQPSLLDRIFKTGKVTIETAGEQNNYILTQVENPYEFARKTIQMHEGSIVEYGN